MPLFFPFALAAAALLALATGSRTGWRTQAEMAEDEKKAAKVQGCVRIAGAPGYWFFWWIWPFSGGRTSHGAVYLTDQAAWQWEFGVRSQSLGVQMQRWVWTGSNWMLDERKDSELLAAAPIPKSSFGAIPVKPPIRGKWTAPGHPPSVNLDGRVFRRAEWQRPIPDVVAQYREDVAIDSRHLFVLRDGSFVVNHIDEFNPDKGNPLAHFMADVVLRPVA